MRTALLRTLLVLGCAAVLVIAAAFAPIVLRSIPAFRVQRVEVTGVRHLRASDAVAAAGIRSNSNLFDDATPWIEALRAYPLVADVRIQRRMPGTIVLHIDEAVPVAFARTPELRAIGANGRVLPIDPADEDMDLPVLSVRTRVSAQGRAVDPATVGIVAFLNTVERVEPGLLGWISEIGMSGDAIRLVLRNAADAEVLIIARPTPERLRELHLTLAELATPSVVHAEDGAGAGESEAELSRVKRIDVRFHDQIVVSMHRGKS